MRARSRRCEAAEQAQRERNASLGRQDRMARYEHEPQQVVADLVVELRRVRVVENLEVDLRLALDRRMLVALERAPAQSVDRAVLRGRHEPRAGFVWHALGWPLLERGYERVLR